MSKKSDLCYQRTRAAEGSGPYRMVFGRNLCDYGQKHRNPLGFPQKTQRNRAEARCQIVEKNPAKRFFDSIIKRVVEMTTRFSVKWTFPQERSITVLHIIRKEHCL